MSTEQASASVDTNNLLRQILQRVTPVKPKLHIFEIACAIVLALATTASAWCAYQSKVWSGAQMARAGAASGAAKEASLSSLAAMQGRAFDSTMFITFMQARIDGNHAMEDFLRARFRPHMKVALEAWLKLDPLNNPTAPPNPFIMADYVQPESLVVARHEENAAKFNAATREARKNSDNYVLLTVVFASVLFFGGIARAFDSRPLRVTMAALAVVLFLGTVAVLTTLPICHE